jgi:hypothetical protein
LHNSWSWLEKHGAKSLCTAASAAP